MAESLKTEALNALPQTAVLQPTDIIPVGSDNGKELKKCTFSTLKKGLGVDSGYRLLAVTPITLSVPQIASGATSSAVTGNYDIADGASMFVPVPISTGFLNCSSCTASGGTLKATFVNVTAVAHSTNAYFNILQFGKF